jgi:Protein of unknown function (DUF5672)
MRKIVTFGTILISVIVVALVLSATTNTETFEMDEKYTAVIVEPRQHAALEFVLANFLENLPENWDVLIMHGTKNREFVERIKDEKLAKYSSRIQLHDLQVDNLTIQKYNELLVSKEFHDQIPAEIFLVFQTDTMICKGSGVQLNEFVKYDYVGAPLPHVDGLVGNGGLSLRKKSKMLEIIEKCKYNGRDPEDYYYANACKGVELSKPNRTTASRFSNEGEYSETSFGVHKPWVMTPANLTKKQQTCKGLDTLIELNR